MPPTPLLIFSDAVSASSGLARIARELAAHIHRDLGDYFRVATIGQGGAGSVKLPWPQYSWTFNDEWIIHDLPEIWEDFAGKEQGVMMTIQDASRMLWFSRPETCTDERVAAFLKYPPFRKWGYFPMDASGPNGKLSYLLGEVLRGYDRVLAYSKWAEQIIVNTLGADAAKKRDLTMLPHGIDTSVFYPRKRGKARDRFGDIACNGKMRVSPETLLIGACATNQARKDYGLMMQVFQRVLKKHKAMFWIHTDALDRFWSLPGLIVDYGLQNNILVTTKYFSDESMAWLYSACDMTFAPGLGEGFGYPIFESMACGTPVIAGDYGGHAEWMPRCLLIAPQAYRLEGIWSCVRPVFEPGQWAKAVDTVPSAVALPVELDWNNLWEKWASWFTRGRNL